MNMWENGLFSSVGVCALCSLWVSLSLSLSPSVSLSLYGATIIFLCVRRKRAFAQGCVRFSGF